MMTKLPRKSPKRPGALRPQNNREDAAEVSHDTVGNPSILSAETMPFPGANVIGVNVQASLWQGQFPPPEAIERYEELLPGTFDRLISMAEKQQNAVIEAAADARSLQQKDTRRGQILGALVTILCVGAAVYCAFIGHISVAIALVAVPIMAVPVALISGKRISAETPQTKITPKKQH